MTPAGKLRELVNFQNRTEEDDGFGNITSGPHVTIWSAPARIERLRGTESVMAGRLAGSQTVAITIRWQPAAATMTTDWRAVDARSGEIWDITSIEPDERKSFVNILAKTGTA
ncbi:head-tail adaptor protein [Ciceribacter thiooxidans]|uniref:Head-tail adaptor protein n=1 Tax=Ciceribacter thiooxidans TaxID=1969821 RepID=A0ABV7I301_9HYPH|nr:head-tail adaptor protein [Ciceribacter thiooxidans]